MIRVAEMTVPELIEKARELPSNEERVALFTHYKTYALKWIVFQMYFVDHTSVMIPSYEANNDPAPICPTSLKNSINRLESIVMLSNNGQVEKAQRNLSVVLESVPASEAELIVMVMSDRKIQGISKSVWKKVFPEFFRLEESS